MQETFMKLWGEEVVESLTHTHTHTHTKLELVCRDHVHISPGSFSKQQLGNIKRTQSPRVAWQRSVFLTALKRQALTPLYTPKKQHGANCCKSHPPKSHGQTSVTMGRSWSEHSTTAKGCAVSSILNHRSSQRPWQQLKRLLMVSWTDIYHTQSVTAFN